MTEFETIGLLFVLFTSLLGTAGLIYAIYRGVTSILRQLARGERERALT